MSPRILGSMVACTLAVPASAEDDWTGFAFWLPRQCEIPELFTLHTTAEIVALASQAVFKYFFVPGVFFGYLIPYFRGQRALKGEEIDWISELEAGTTFLSGFSYILLNALYTLGDEEETAGARFADLFNCFTPGLADSIELHAISKSDGYEIDPYSMLMTASIWGLDVETFCTKAI